MASGLRKELQTLIRLAQKQGWRVELNKSGHYKWYSPSGGMVCSASSPSDVRAIKNIIRELRKLGFIEIKK